MTNAGNAPPQGARSDFFPMAKWLNRNATGLLPSALSPAATTPKKSFAVLPTTAPKKSTQTAPVTPSKKREPLSTRS